MHETDVSGATDIPREQQISNEYDDDVRHVVVAISERTLAKDIAICWGCFQPYLRRNTGGTLTRGRDAPFANVTRMQINKWWNCRAQRIHV